MIVDVSHSVWNNELNIFSSNRTISLAKRQASTHCCELPQVWRKCFPKQSRKAKVYGKMFIFIVCQSVWENVYILILIMIIRIGRCYANVLICQHTMVDGKP